MFIQKSDCTFEIVQHDKLTGNTTPKKKITMEIEVEGEKHNYEYTNAGFRKPKGSWFCAKKFNKSEAKRFIEDLPERLFI